MHLIVGTVLLYYLYTVSSDTSFSVVLKRWHKVIIVFVYPLFYLPNTDTI
jgi:hypothetical protein